jgi:hypothetical protein
VKLARRDFLALGLACAAAPLGCARRHPRLEAALAAFFPDAGAARALGEEFLVAYPAEDERDALLRQLAGGRESAWEALAAGDPAALREALREAHRADLAEGRVVLVRGWLLSQTEARLCALAARAS